MRTKASRDKVIRFIQCDSLSLKIAGYSYDALCKQGETERVLPAAEFPLEQINYKLSAGKGEEGKRRTGGDGRTQRDPGLM